MQPPTAADDDDFLYFSHDDIFFSSTPSFSKLYNDDDRALQRTFSATHYCHASKLHGATFDLSADSTTTSPLLCDTAYSSVSF